MLFYFDAPYLNCCCFSKYIKIISQVLSKYYQKIFFVAHSFSISLCVFGVFRFIMMKRVLMNVLLCSFRKRFLNVSKRHSFENVKRNNSLAYIVDSLIVFGMGKCRNVSLSISQRRKTVITILLFSSNMFE